MTSLFRAIGYALSLPERTVRSLAGAVGGVSKLLTDTLLPRSLRRTAIYKSMVGNTQKLLIQGLAGIRLEKEQPLPEDYLARKIAGDVVDGIGVFAFHFSPMWFFAIVGDAAGGTKEYLGRVVAELKKDGVLEADASIGSTEALLDALAEASRRSRLPFDAPPLSKDDLAKLKDEVAGGYKDLYARGKAALPSVDSLWAAVEDVRKRDKVEFLRLMGTMALAAPKAAAKASGRMFWEKVVLSYRDSLADAQQEGFGKLFARETRPYLEGVAGAFSPGKKSWTERLLGGELFGGKPKTQTPKTRSDG